ncbi:MAG: NAD(P)-binding protein [Polyangiales bacterium]
MADIPRPLRVAIIGGGCAAMTAALALTRPSQHGRFEVEIFQMGWRLGGKGASGRGPSQRVEEHGLHLWMGFYENAFRLMREVYDEAARDPRTCPVATFAQAFEPSPDVAVTDRDADGAWRHWVARFPPGRGQPGEALAPHNPFTVYGYLQQTASLVVEMIRSTHAAPAGAPRRPRNLAGAVERLLRYGHLATAAALHEAAELLRALFDTLSPRVFHRDREGLALRLLDALARAGQAQMERVVARDPELERVWQVVDMVLAILRGAVRFGLAVHPRGFDAIDDYDWREWLRLNGAAERSLDAGFMRGIYDLAFAYEDGDVSRPRISAAVALRGAMRMFFTYRGALFWRMTAGMGDIVFAPMYEVLKRRGVRFRFFHRLAQVRVADGAPGEPPHVAALEFDVQADVRRGEYQPLVDVDGLPCWPSAPDYAQLRDGEALRAAGVAFESPWESRVLRRETRRVGEHFDLVVLAPSVAALPLCASEILDRVPAWREMVQRVKTVPTQALQLWLREDRAGLGWQGPPVNLSGFVEPFDTWADLTHLAPVEGWREAPKHIAYFCSVLDDRPVPAGAEAAFERDERARVQGHAETLLNRDIGGIWPRAVRADGSFRWELLSQEGARPRRDAGALRTQYWTANVRPTERYVLSLPGTSRYRISPLSLHLDNLTVAGDWTETGLNSGCVESAVISGLLAAHALSGSPHLEDIVGYDHP